MCLCLHVDVKLTVVCYSNTPLGYTLKISRVKSHNFLSCDEKSHDFSCEKCVSCDFTREKFPRVMKNYTIFHVNECMRK